MKKKKKLNKQINVQEHLGVILLLKKWLCINKPIFQINPVFAIWVMLLRHIHCSLFLLLLQSYDSVFFLLHYSEQLDKIQSVYIFAILVKTDKICLQEFFTNAIWDGRTQLNFKNPDQINSLSNSDLKLKSSKTLYCFLPPVLFLLTVIFQTRYLEQEV